MKIAENGSFCKAAEELHLSQPPLSRQIQNLESELDAKLFERSVKGVSLTDEGKRLYAHAEALIAHNDFVLREIASKNGIIRFGATSSSIDYSLSLIEEYNLYDSVNFEITESNTFKLTEMLDNNLIDFAFVRTPFKINPHFRHIKLLNDKLIVIGSPKFLGSRNDSISVYELSKLPLAVIRRWKEHIDMIAYQKGLSLNCKYICDDNRTSLSIASNEMGVAIVPSSTMTSYFGAKPLVKKIIKENPFDTSIFFVYQPTQRFNTPTLNFIDFVLSKPYSS